MVEPPTAVHSDALTQLTDCKAVDPAGVPWSLQTEPPSVVAMTWAPAARQVVSLGQEMPLRLVIAVGGVWGTQLVPPLLVERITALGPPEESPTAVQCMASGQEIPVKLVTTPG